MRNSRSVLASRAGLGNSPATGYPEPLSPRPRWAAPLDSPGPPRWLSGTPGSASSISTTGDQPIASEDERTRIVVNGEFYGYEAIQRELEQSGHRLRTRSDSEIALHLYEDLGAQCLHRLRGEFAFVLWDETNRTIFAARDRFGIKPLFYAFHGERSISHRK